jgi:hypothetical protein
MKDNEALSPPSLDLFQQVADLARKVVQIVAGENEEHLQKEDEVVKKNVQDEVVSRIEDDEIVVATPVNAAEEEHQKVDTPQNVEENPSDQDQKVEENNEQASHKVDKDTQEDAEILASQIMSQGNAQVLKDEHMEFSSGFDLNIEDLNSYFNTDVF